MKWYIIWKRNVHFVSKNSIKWVTTSWTHSKTVFHFKNIKYQLGVVVLIKLKCEAGLLNWVGFTLIRIRPNLENQIRIRPHFKNRIRPCFKNRIRIWPYFKNRVRIRPNSENRIRIWIYFQTGSGSDYILKQDLDPTIF